MKHDLDLFPSGEADFRDNIDIKAPKETKAKNKCPQRTYRLPKIALMWLLMEISFSNASGAYLARKFGISEAMVSKYKAKLRAEWASRQTHLVLYRKDGTPFF